MARKSLRSLSTVEICFSRWLGKINKQIRHTKANFINAANCWECSIHLYNPLRLWSAANRETLSVQYWTTNIWLEITKVGKWLLQRKWNIFGRVKYWTLLIFVWRKHKPFQFARTGVCGNQNYVILQILQIWGCLCEVQSRIQESLRVMLEHESHPFTCWQQFCHDKIFRFLQEAGFVTEDVVKNWIHQQMFFSKYNLPLQHAMFAMSFMPLCVLCMPDNDKGFTRMDAENEV